MLQFSRGHENTQYFLENTQYSINREINLPNLKHVKYMGYSGITFLGLDYQIKRIRETG